MNNNNTTYKDSPLGKIPSDWEVKELGELTTLLTNGFVGKSKEHYVEDEDGVIYIQGYNVTESGFNFNGIKKVSKSFHSKNRKSSLEEGDLLTIQTGDIGVTAVVPKELIGANCHALVISRFKRDLAYPYFYLHYFNSELGRRKLKTIETGSTMKHLNVGDMFFLQLPLPSLPEQKAIANVLGLMDSAININNQLIAKTKLQKKWLMQNLLTGKKRLKRFGGEWKEFHLRSLGDTYSGLTGKSKEDFGTGKPYIPYLNIFLNSKIDPTNFDYVKITELDKQNKAKYGDIFFTVSSETPDEVGMASVLLNHINELYLNSFCFGFRLYNFKTLIPEFSSYFLRADAFREEIYKLSQGATRFNLSKNNLMKLNVILPSPEEQTAIAEVLQAADKEIQLLKAKTEKLREQKKGLMQVLLTGKKRLTIIHGNAWT